MNIGIDIDGTVTEAFYWLKRANAFFGTEVTESSIVHYEYYKSLGKGKSDCDQFLDLFGEILHWEAEIRPGAQSVINRLYKHHQIHFISARAEEMRQVTLKWFDKYDIPMHTITLLGCTHKVDTAVRLECDLFIEDRYENSLQLADAGFNVLLMDCSYNQGEIPSNVTRVTGWYQIDQYISAYETVRKLEIAL